MSGNRARRIVAAGARLTVGAILAVASVAGVAFAVSADIPGFTAEPASTQITPTAGDTTLVCNGPFRALGRDTTDATKMTAAGTPTLVTGGTVSGTTELAIPDLDGATSTPSALTGEAQGEDPALIAAAESITLSEGDLTGLAAAACREARTESWLIGGTVATGSNDVIILSNPGDVSATVTLTVYGTDAQSVPSIVVPAHTQTAVPLVASAAGLQQPVVRVTAAGAPVRAVLQSSLVRTLDPAGIDIQDGTDAPADELLFTGVQVVADGTDSPTSVLRLLATETATSATVTVTPEGSTEAAYQTAVPLEAGTPVEVELPGLPLGAYSVQVSADASLVGAVWQSGGAVAGTDFAWMTPAPQLSGDVLFAVPDGPSPRVHLLNDGEADASVTLQAADGTEQNVTVPAGESVSVDVAASTSYTLHTDEPVRAAVTLSSGTSALAGWPIWPGASAQQALTVYP